MSAPVQTTALVVLDRGAPQANPPSDGIAIINDGGTLKQQAPDGTKTALGGGSAQGWLAGRQARANALLNSGAVQVNNPYPIDFLHTPGTISGTGLALSTAYSGGVYVFGATASAINTVLPFNQSIAVAAPKTESWYTAALIRIEANVTDAGTFVMPLRLINGGGHAIEIIWDQTVSTTIGGLLIGDGSNVNTPLGSVGTLGQATCPLGAWFTIEMWFNAAAGTLNVGCSDTTALSLSGASLNHMPTDAQWLGMLSSSPAAALKCGGLFMMLKGLV
jgi:hypothetical protein